MFVWEKTRNAETSIEQFIIHYKDNTEPWRFHIIYIYIYICQQGLSWYAPPSMKVARFASFNLALYAFSELSKAANVNRVSIRRWLRAVRSSPDDHVSRLRWVECIPEQVLVPVLARCLERQASNLPVVPPDSAAPCVRHHEAWSFMRRELISWEGSRID